jgi:hypothetical protein
MQDLGLPEKTCEIDRLVRHPLLVAAVLAGSKTQQRRDGLYAYPGEVFVLDGVEFEVTSVVRQPVAEMTDADAQAEGYPSFAAYKAFILSMPAHQAWNPDGWVWVHSFKRRTLLE